jgi:colanic acid/amylovoran biosynthesis glycosyltransferase
VPTELSTDTRPEPAAPTTRRPPRAPHLRLAYLVTSYPAVSHTFILREIRGLRARGVDVQVISVHGADRADEHLTAAERAERRATEYVLARSKRSILATHVATLFRRPRTYVRGLWKAMGWSRLDLRRSARDLAYFAEAVIVWEVMRRGGLHHVHAHFCSHLAAAVARVFPVTFSATIHGPVELEDRRYRGLAAQIAAAEFLCPTSRYARSALMLESRAEHWPKLVPIELGVPVGEYAPAARAGRPGPLRIICVGRLDAQKGHHVLLGALQALRDGGRSVLVHLVGDGSLRAELEEAAARRGLGGTVVFLGALNAEEARHVFAAADAFVLASLAEGMPVALMEAMALGLPCVATAVGGTPELLRDGVDGLLVPPADEQALAAALARLVDDAELRARLGASARARVVDAYDFDDKVDELHSEFAARLGASRGAAARV